MCDLTLEEIAYVLKGHIYTYEALAAERDKLFRSIIIDTDKESRDRKSEQYISIEKKMTELEKRYDDYWVPILREKGIDEIG